MKGRGIANAAPRALDMRATCRPGRVGTYLNETESCGHRLARAIHRAESENVATSWSAQERAESYYNERGMAASLNEATRLETLALECWK